MTRTVFREKSIGTSRHVFPSEFPCVGGRRVASIATGGQVALVDGSKGEVVQCWQAHDAKMESWTCRLHLGMPCSSFSALGCLSPDGTLLATGGDDRRMKLWDVRTPATDGPVRE